MTSPATQVSSILQKRLNQVLPVMNEVAKYLGKEYERTPTVSFKDARNIRTQADMAAENTIRTKLEVLFPNDAVYGEERGLSGNAKNPDGVWFVDALDGTTNFACGIPVFCTQIAYVTGEDVVLSAILVPFNDERFTAIRSGGAQRNGVPIRVCDPPNGQLKKAIVVLSRRSDDAEIARHAAIYASVADPRTGARTLRVFNSAAGDFVRLAHGRTHASIHNGANAYDVLPGMLLVQEAGGVTTDFSGNPVRLPRMSDALSAHDLRDTPIDVLMAAPSIQAELLKKLGEFAR